MIPLMILQEKKFGDDADKSTDYTNPDGGDDKDETPPDTDAEQADPKSTDNNDTDVDNNADADADTTDPETDPDADTGGSDKGTDTTGDDSDDYTIDSDAEEMADDDDSDETDPQADVNADSPIPEDQDKVDIKKISRLLDIYRQFYKDTKDLTNKVVNTLFPTNVREEFLYKIIVTTLNKLVSLMYTYITTQYNTKSYEENVYSLYNFKSQIEIVNILIKKIKKSRDSSKTI